MRPLDKFIKTFIKLISENFPDSRLTYQKGIATFHPDNLDEAAELITLANKAQQKLFITGFGNNIDPIGPAFEKLVVMRTDFLGQMIEINESGLSVVVGAGFPLREINAKLEPAGLFLPIGELPYTGSVGGAIAVGLSAKLDEEHWEQKDENQSISIERYILRLDVATPTGESKSLGVATEKHSSGENFAKIFSPSWGLFGFIASAKFRVAPLSAKGEYQNMRATKVSRENFIGADSATLENTSNYISKLRQKLDPQEIFPIISSKVVYDN